MTSSQKLKDNYQICSQCVMDTTDPAITFDSGGVCCHCRGFEEKTKKSWFPNEEGEKRLADILNQIRAVGRNQEYDCIIGLSGGVDSCYLALKVKEWDLRPLVVHVDAGWNSELAVANIEKVVKYCGYHLHTHVVVWGEMRDLHLAFLRAAVSNQDVPQDHVFSASMYHFATQNRIKYILTGGNIATECIFPKAWHGSAMDAINLKAIHRKYGNRALKTFTTISFFQYYIGYPFFKGMRTVRPLNYIPYNKASAINEMEILIGWRSYGRKHGESIFTKLFQNYYLPAKFGYDKRRPHFSSMIVTGQMTREEALERLKEPLYDPHELENDIDYFCKKLKITWQQFEEFINAPTHHYTDFPNWDDRYLILKKVQSFAAHLLGREISVYS